ncbi:hypothetical protein I4200191B4_30690 [Pseudoflavonifractor gallinarum]
MLKTTSQNRKGRLLMYYEFRWVCGHVEVYDHAGRFCFSADSEQEAREELSDAA